MHINSSALGGQHNAADGVSTLHHQCTDDFCVELKRRGEELEHYLAMQDFEREWQRIIASEEPDIAF
jgi:hypothetical protein